MAKRRKTFSDRVRARVLEVKGSWPQLVVDAEVTYPWIRKFASGEIKDPGAERLQRLADVLGVEHRQ